MRFIRRTNFYHVLDRIPKKITHPELQEVFSGLCEIIRPYQKNLVIKKNSAVHYELWTNHAYRVNNLQYRGRKIGQQIKSRTGIQFAAAVVFKGWVSFYLYPLYLSADLRAEMSDELRSHLFRNSKSCMHFTTLTEEMKTELQELVKKCWAYYESQYWVKPLD